MEKFRRNYRLFLIILVLIAVFFSVLGRFSLNRPPRSNDPAQPVFQLEIPGLNGIDFSIGGKIRNLIFVALIFWLAGCIWDRKLRPSLSGLEIPVALFLAVFSLSFLLSRDRSLSWDTGFRTMLLQAAWFFLLVSVLKPEKFQKAVLTALFSALFLTVLAGLFLYHRQIYFPQTPERIWLSFGHPNSGGAVLILLIPLALSPLIFTAPGRIKISSVGLTLWLLLSLFLTFSRTAWVSLLIGLGVLSAGRKARYIFLGGLCILAAVLVWGLNVGPQAYWKKRIKSFATWRSDPNINKRLIYWNAAGRMIRERPLLGWGPGYGVFIDTYETGYKEVDTDEKVTAPHNYYLSLAVSVGLIGLGAFLFLVISVYRLSYRELRAGESWFGKSYPLGLMAGLTAFLVGSLIDDPLLNERISFIFWLLLGILGARLAVRRETGTNPEANSDL